MNDDTPTAALEEFSDMLFAVKTKEDIQRLLCQVEQLRQRYPTQDLALIDKVLELFKEL